MNRDRSLDVWKGLGCLLMVVAHTQVDPNAWVLLLRFVGEMAPLVFFPVAGVTAWLQAQRRPLRELAIYYALIAILGFSVAGLVQGQSWHPFYLDMVSLIGVASLLVALAVKAGVEQFWLFWLGIGIGIIGIFFPQPALGFAWFSPNEGSGLYFSIFPWAGFFFCGAGLYGAGRQKALWVTGLVMAVMLLWPAAIEQSTIARRVLVVSLGPLVLDFVKAPAVSLDYFGLGVLLAIVIVCVRVKLPEWRGVEWAVQWFADLGAKSLLYCHLHLILVLISAPFLSDQPLLKWSALFILSSIFTKSYARSADVGWMKRHFQTPWPWGILSLAMLLTPLMGRGGDWVTCVIVGFLFASQLGSLRVMLRQYFDTNSMVREGKN